MSSAERGQRFNNPLTDGRGEFEGLRRARRLEQERSGTKNLDRSSPVRFFEGLVGESGERNRERWSHPDPAALKLIHLGGVKLIHPKLNNQTTAS